VGRESWLAGHRVSDLARVFTPDIIEAIGALVEERVATVLAEHQWSPNAVQPPRQWLSLSEAAAELGVDPRTLRRHVERGRIRVAPFGRRRLVNRDDIDAFLRAQLK
jgi:excisionase family DNA binding protein